MATGTAGGHDCSFFEHDAKKLKILSISLDKRGDKQYNMCVKLNRAK